MRRPLGLTSLFVICLSIWGTALPAQDETRPPTVPTADQAAGSGAIAEEAPPARDPQDRIIYIPFEDLEGAFESPDSNIVLPYAEYRKLLLAWKNAQMPKTSPDAVITEAAYSITIDGELARIQARLTIDVLGDPWVEVPIQFGDAAVGRVQGDVLMRGTGDGQYALLFNAAGTQTVELELATRVHQSPDGNEFSFACPPVAVTTIDVTVPRKDQAIEIQPRIIAIPVDEPEGDLTRVKASLGSTESITVRWHPRTSLKPEMNLLASVTNQTLVTVEDGLIHTDAYLTYEVLRGSLEQFQIAVPQTHRILDVDSQTRIKSWKTTVEGGNQVLNVELLAGVEKSLTIEIHTEQKLDGVEFRPAGLEESGQVFGIHALDAVRESGQLVIRHGADLSLTVIEQQGVVRIPAAEVHQRLAGDTNALMYKFYSPQFVLQLAARPVEPRLIVNHQVLETFQDEELQFQNTLQFVVERAGVFDLIFQLPDDVEIDAVQCPQLKEFNVDAATSQLTVSLRERTLGAINVVIRGHRDLADHDGSEQELPIIEPLGVERETGTILVYAKEAIEVITNQDGLQSAQPLPTARAARQGNTILNSAWSFTRRPVVIPVRTERKPTRISSNVATAIDVQPEVTHVRTLLDFLVEYSGVDTYRFDIPESVSDSIQIELESGDQNSSPIKQKTASDPVDGRVTWTVITQREVVGRQRLVITYDVRTETAPEDDSADTDQDADAADADANGAEAPETPEAELDISVVRPLGLADADGEIVTPISRVHGEIAVLKERTLSITADASGGGVEAIDIRELSLLPATGALAFRYFKDDPEDRTHVALTRTRHEIQEVVSTVVSRGLVEIVTGEDAEATYRCRFRVKTTERQRLLIHLPVNLDVLGAFVNEREVKLEQAELDESQRPGGSWAPFWLNVARAESSETPFLLTFQFLWKVNPPLGESDYGRGKIMFPLPIIGDGGSVIQELKAVVWVSEEYTLVGDPHRFHLETSWRPSSVLMGRLANPQTDHLEYWVTDGQDVSTGFIDFPTEGRRAFVYTNLGGAPDIEIVWWNRLMMTLIFSGAIALIGWILMRTSWENKLSMLILAAFVAALYGLRDSHALSQGLDIARFGIAILIGLWLIQAIFSWTNHVHHTTAKRMYTPSDISFAVIPPPGVFEPEPKPPGQRGGGASK